MSFQVEYSGEVPLVILPEKIDLTNSGKLKEVLFSLCEEGHGLIKLDFNKVFSMDSSGLGKLIIAQKKLRDSGGELRIINVKSSSIMDLFHSIDLHKVLIIE